VRLDTSANRGFSN
jgi:hypothetical protein